MTTSTTNGSRRNSEDKIELFDEYRGGIPKSLTIESEQPHTSESKENTIAFNERMQRRRTVREFSPRPVPREIIESCIRAAGCITQSQPKLQLRWTTYSLNSDANLSNRF